MPIELGSSASPAGPYILLIDLEFQTVLRACGGGAVERVHLLFQKDALPVTWHNKHCRPAIGRPVLNPRHDDDEIRTLGAGNEPFSAIDDIAVSINSRRRRQRGIGPGTIRLVIAKQERAPLARGEKLLPPLGLRDTKQVGIALIRRAAMQGSRAEQGIPSSKTKARSR